MPQEFIVPHSEVTCSTGYCNCIAKDLRIVELASQVESLQSANNSLRAGRKAYFDALRAIYGIFFKVNNPTRPHVPKIVIEAKRLVDSQPRIAIHPSGSKHGECTCGRGVAALFDWCPECGTRQIWDEVKL